MSIESDQAPDAEQDVALVEDQVRVKLVLTSTEPMLEKIDAVGAGVVPPPPSPPPVPPPSPPPVPPPPPQLARMKVEIIRYR